MLCSVAAVLAACTEPNPFLHDDGDSSGAGSSDTGTSATASSTVTTTASTASTSASSTASSTDGTASATDTTATEGTATDATTTSDGCGSVCVPSPSGLWNGPVAIIVSDPADDAPTCAGDFDEPSTTVYDELAAGPTQCACTCGDPEGVTCSTTSLRQYSQAACAAVTDTTNVDGMCNDTVSSGGGNIYFTAESHTLGGTCDADVSDSVFPAAAFQVRETACALSAPENTGCAGGEICVPGLTDPFDGRLCIWAEGDQVCPEQGTWTERVVRWTSWEDQRDCSECTCDHEGAECSGAVYLFDEDACGGLPVANVPINGACITSGIVGSARVTGAGVTPDPTSCTPAVGDPIGELVPGGAVTFCCQG